MSLTQDQVDHYYREGYLIAKDVLDADDFYPIEQGLGELIDKKARDLAAEGEIRAAQSDKPFSHRLAAISAELSDDAYAGFRSFTSSLDTMRAQLRPVFDFFFNSRLLSTLASLIGPEITLSPIQHLRPYLPARGGDQPGQVPWHQD